MSTVPAVIDALLVKLTGLAPAGFDVADGWPATGSPSWIAVSGGDGPTVDGALEMADIDQDFYSETYAVSVVIHSAVGTQKECRDRVCAVFDALRDALRSDERIGGILQGPARAYVEGFSLEQPGAADVATGFYAAVTATVRVIDSWV